MDEHWARVKDVLTTHSEVPEAHADALIARTTEGAWSKDRIIPEWCEGLSRADFCSADWLALKYWTWKGGGYVGYSYRQALYEAEKASKNLKASPSVYVGNGRIVVGHAFTPDELVEGDE